MGCANILWAIALVVASGDDGAPAGDELGLVQASNETFVVELTKRLETNEALVNQLKKRLETLQGRPGWDEDLPAEGEPDDENPLLLDMSDEYPSGNRTASISSPNSMIQASRRQKRVIWMGLCHDKCAGGMYTQGWFYQKKIDKVDRYGRNLGSMNVAYVYPKHCSGKPKKITSGYVRICVRKD